MAIDQPQVRSAPQRRRLLTATTLILLILFLASLAAAGFIEVLRGGWMAAIRKQDVELARLEKQRENWRERNGELARKVEMVRTVLDENCRPLPAWFLGLLERSGAGRICLLTELHVARTNNAWFVKMAGQPSPRRALLTRPSFAPRLRP
jgi:hypothetical protein